jgi:hypothetical protein
MDGYQGEVIDGVSLDYDMNAIHLWPDGEPCPQPLLGRDPANPRHYKVFKSALELREADFELVFNSAPFVEVSWSAYQRRYPYPAELAAQVSQEDWFDYLDEIDEAIKRQREKFTEPELPSGSDQIRIAEWVAKRHLSADGSIRQVYYLPTESPQGEIRLLEVSDRITGANGKPEPIDFGIEVAGVALRLRVADVTSDQFERIRKDPSNLPPGWRLDGALVWGTRA